jgi:RNA polymerase sigma factor (sigma-70 family)
VLPDFDSLYTLYNGQIRAMLWKRGCREPLDDVMQDFWLRVYRNLNSTFDPGRDLERWLCTVALNAWRMNWRAEKSWLRRAVYVGQVVQFPSQIVWRVLVAINKLPSRQRYALIGRLKGYNCTEIADRMGVETDTVVVLCYRGRRELLARGW